MAGWLYHSYEAHPFAESYPMSKVIKQGQDIGIDLLTFRDEGPGTPAVGADPVELSRGVLPLDGLHQLGHLLVRPEHDHACKSHKIKNERMNNTTDRVH